MPFAALKGFSEALQKKEKAFVPQAELSEEYQEELNRRLQKIRKDDFISIVYYHNGEYLRISGAVVKILTPPESSPFFPAKIFELFPQLSPISMISLSIS